MPTERILHIVPESHIDVVWLWRYDPETIHRCCKPTFTQATDNLDLFDDYTYCQSQVPLYEPVARIYPRLFERILHYIREGRWEVVGGMYVEPEGGEPDGESLVRQCLYGQRYFQRTFGAINSTGWQQDAWSHPWQLPQILAKSGMDCYMFRRGEKGDKVFWWQSPDGSRLLACRPFTTPPAESWRESLDLLESRYGVTNAMFLVGKGDHGGGATPVDIEGYHKLDQQTASGGTRVRFSTFRQYMDALKSQADRLPVLNDELGFELEGDLTNCCEIKKNNRLGEIGLENAEKFAACASLLHGVEYPREELEEAWKKLLFNQFHDILGGSLIPPAYDDAMVMYRSVNESAACVQQVAIKALAAHINTRGEGIPILLANPTAWPRTESIEIGFECGKSFEPRYVTSPDGAAAHFQLINREETEKGAKIRGLFIAQALPAFGWRVYHVVQTGSPLSLGETAVQASQYSVENAFYRVELDPASGYIRQIWDKARGHDVLAAGAQGNVLIAIEDEGDSEGRFMRGHDKAPQPPGAASIIDSAPVIQIVESGPIRACLRIERKYQNSTFTQDILLSAGIPRIDFALRVDWHDVHRFIKTAFPMAPEKPEVTYDGPYAAIVRPADGCEYPAQKWVDLSASDYGVALINNARYAHDVKDQTVRLNILRSPTQPAYNTDEGVHTLGYALYPHAGSWRDAGVLEQGYAFNHPIAVFQAEPHDGAEPPEGAWLTASPGTVVIESFKKAEDEEAYIVRGCEWHGQSATFELSMPKPIVKAEKTDLLERSLETIAADGNRVKLEIGPYEIFTLKIAF